MHPILFEIGPLQIPAYGVNLMLAFFISTKLMERKADAMGVDSKKLFDLAVWALLFGLVGAKTLLIALDIDFYIKYPRYLKDTLFSAGVLYGGIIGGTAAVVYFIRRYQMPFWKTLDIMAPHMALAIGLGRLSCFLAGCCYGVHYDGFGAVTFPDHPKCMAPAGEALFPVQLLAVLNGVVLYAILNAILNRSKCQGQVVALFFVLYGLTRGSIEFLRGDVARGIWFNNALSTSQLIAGIAILAGTGLFIWRRKAGASS